MKSERDDRVAGTLLAAACGDALGVHYEPSQRGPADGDPQMLGGGYGHYAPGEYSDDTQMAVVIAQVAASGADLRSEDALDRVASGFVQDWFGGGATDVGAQTRALLGRAAARPPVDAASLRSIGADLHRESGRTAGNGSLMRTSPVALAFLGQADAMAEAARAVSALTHHDPVAGEACVLWCLAISHAVLTGSVDLSVGLSRVPESWEDRIREAETRPVSDFAAQSGWVVAALQGAWAAVFGVRDIADPAERLRKGLVAAVNGGGDTDTVAAIAGALLGASCGASAVPAEWRAIVHGWPGLDADGLEALALACRRG
ncbi:ADP-ribosylglycohydrolase family protein [Cryptosporangium phraense]|uniref:ADP-ribosylglycohydrolase family protein n=1 Tax=Cryptosporangium phraense TaxID=2593070 RepID=A0A545ARA5_9ACTN|nr:ADP-ribosylglycohydrolase family protein [Cryptosporangium phraense]TQS43866.1 ADP-ribosylglycohydrolase family protein [Cryptosporangium phraense]